MQYFSEGIVDADKATKSLYDKLMDLVKEKKNHIIVKEIQHNCLELSIVVHYKEGKEFTDIAFYDFAAQSMPVAMIIENGNKVKFKAWSKNKSLRIHIDQPDLCMIMRDVYESLKP